MIHAGYPANRAVAVFSPLFLFPSNQIAQTFILQFKTFNIPPPAVGEPKAFDVGNLFLTGW